MAERISRTSVEAGLAEQARAALAEVEAQIAEHWVWYLVLGIVLLAAGVAAIAFPYLSTLAAKIALGWIFLVSGIFMIFQAFSVGAWRGFLFNLLIGILYAIAGGYLVFFPLAGILTLTLLVAALFFADGVLEVAMAFRIRPHRGWGWMLTSGLVAIAAGILIAMQLPYSATWVIGVLVGIKMIFAGWSYIALALSAHRGPGTSTALHPV